MKGDNYVVMEFLMLDSVPPLPELNKLALSSGIRESLSVVPKELQVPVLFSIATVIGGIATQVRLQYHGYHTGKTCPKTLCAGCLSHEGHTQGSRQNHKYT